MNTIDTEVHIHREDGITPIESLLTYSMNIPHTNVNITINTADENTYPITISNVGKLETESIQVSSSELDRIYQYLKDIVRIRERGEGNVNAHRLQGAQYVVSMRRRNDAEGNIKIVMYAYTRAVNDETIFIVEEEENAADGVYVTTRFVSLRDTDYAIHMIRTQNHVLALIMNAILMSIYVQRFAITIASVSLVYETTLIELVGREGKIYLNEDRLSFYHHITAIYKQDALLRALKFDVECMYAIYEEENKNVYDRSTFPHGVRGLAIKDIIYHFGYVPSGQNALNDVLVKSKKGMYDDEAHLEPIYKDALYLEFVNILHTF